MLQITTYTGLGRNGPVFLRKWQRLDGFDHQISREVTADEADHLVIIESRNNVIVRSAVEDLANLLQEALSVELRGADKRVLSQENVLTSQRRIEAIGNIFR